MNRELKFRFFDTKKNKWETNPDFSLDDIFIKNADNKPCFSFCSSENIVVQQSTDAKDKNEKEIYEGDILEFYKNRPYEATYEVIWDNKNASFKLISAKREGDEFGVFTEAINSAFYHASIIGNIFENPELLNK